MKRVAISSWRIFMNAVRHESESERGKREQGAPSISCISILFRLLFRDWGEADSNPSLAS